MSNMRLSLYGAAMLAVLAAACADENLTQPLPNDTPRFSQVANEGRYIVELNGKAGDLEAAVSALGGVVEFAHEEAGLATVSGLTPEAATKLSKAKGVGAVHEDIVFQLSPQSDMLEAFVDAAEITSPANPTTAVRYSFQWNMRRVKADVAWAAGLLGSPDVTVAILDSGIDSENLDMVGVVDPARSISFVPSDDAFMDQWLPTYPKWEDLNGHGTNVATQVSSNSIYLAGINTQVRLMAVKVLGRSGSGSLAGILNGLIYAADNGADVANMSLGIRFGVDKRGNGQFMGATNRVFNYAHRKGMLIVVSAGNDAANMDNEGLIFRAYCEAPHVICVSALGPTASANAFSGPWENEDALADYSNFGKQIAVSAPGGTIFGWVPSVCARHRVTGIDAVTGAPVFGCLTPAPTSAAIVGYAGTSQAAPHVAGLAAKLIDKVGKNNPAQLKHALLKNSVDDLGAPGDDPVYGAGRINVQKAMGL